MRFKKLLYNVYTKHWNMENIQYITFLSQRASAMEEFDLRACKKSMNACVTYALASGERI